MTQQATRITQAEHAASHDPAGVCWLCSDQVSWWAEARRKAGYELMPRLERKVEEPPEKIEIVIPATGRVVWRCSAGRKNHEWRHLHAFLRECVHCSKQEGTRNPWA